MNCSDVFEILDHVNRTGHQKNYWIHNYSLHQIEILLLSCFSCDQWYCFNYLHCLLFL